MNSDDLTEGQRAKAKACQTPEELLTLASGEGFELTGASSVKQTCLLARL